jgi:hypothetical protein
LKGYLNNRPDYQFSEILGKIESGQINSCNMDSLTGILPVAKGGTGNSVAGNTTLENLGLLVKDTTKIGVNL